ACFRQTCLRNRNTTFPREPCLPSKPRNASEARSWCWRVSCYASHRFLLCRGRLRAPQIRNPDPRAGNKLHFCRRHREEGCEIALSKRDRPCYGGGNYDRTEAFRNRPHDGSPLRRAVGFARGRTIESTDTIPAAY